MPLLKWPMSALRKAHCWAGLLSSIMAVGGCSDAPIEPAKPAEQSWRSGLYPDDWAAGFVTGDGLGLQDFSYAGYRGGELIEGPPVGTAVFDVLDFGADLKGEQDSTSAVASAISAAESAGAGVVFFPAGDYRFDGVLTVGQSHIVLRGEGAELSRLWFTSSDGMSHKSHISFLGAVSDGPDLPLAQDAAAKSFVVEIQDASGLSPGDDVALGWMISEPFVAEHGMVGTWQAFNDSWQPFFLREVVAVDSSVTPHRVRLDVPLRYPAKVRDGASLRKQTGYLRDSGIERLGLSNAVSWQQAWQQDQVHVLELRGVKDCWARELASFASPAAPRNGPGSNAHLQSGGLMVIGSKRVTVADSTLSRAQHRGPGGNGYLFEVRQSSEILFRDCRGVAGRHNFIQNWGFGASGCVWLRVHSQQGEMWDDQEGSFKLVGHSEFHHSLAMANLIDASSFDDGWSMINRAFLSSGAGHTGTESVLWNVQGSGQVRSWQFGRGYVIGSAETLDVRTALPSPAAAGTEPEDYAEGIGRGVSLEPPSLYEDQRARRLAR